jgi:hypothetical protein
VCPLHALGASVILNCVLDRLFLTVTEGAELSHTNDVLREAFQSLEWLDYAWQAGQGWIYVYVCKCVYIKIEHVYMYACIFVSPRPVDDHRLVRQ